MVKVTIITVCYNDKEKLKKTIESVCHQAYSNIEHLIIDGGSTDGTIDVLKEYAFCQNIIFYSEKDYGIYNAMNRGIARASGDYVCFLNAGDTFFDDQVLSEVVHYIGEDRDAIYYGKTCMVYPDGLKQIQDFTENAADLKELMITGDMPCHQAIFSPRKALVNHYFREQYKIRADYEWLFYSITHGYLCKTVPNIICYYDMSGSSGTMKNMIQLQQEEQEIIDEYQKNFTDSEVDFCQKVMADRERVALRYTHLFYLMNYWLMLKQKNISIGKYLWEKGYRHVGIYGMSHMGLNLLRELEEWDIKIDYAIDRNAENLCVDIKTCSPDEALEMVDAIVVTALEHFEVIKEMLNKKIDCPVLSLETLIYETKERQF